MLNSLSSTSTLQLRHSFLQLNIAPNAKMNRKPRECNIASHLYVPQYKNLWALAKDKGYIGFAYDVDNCNPGIIVDKDSMDAVYTESVYDLFKEHDKNLRIDPQLKQELLTYALAQVTEIIFLRRLTC
jgi:hypothetical protein